MKIAYGVMGYGRGHATRSAAVLPTLMAQHEVRVFAGNDAYDALHAHFPTTQIPCIGYRYDSHGKLSMPLTIIGNYPIVKDALFKGPFYQRFCNMLADWGVDAIITDSEIWTTRAAKQLGIPLISFDHVGIINHCLPPFPPKQWFRGHLDRTLITSFYSALPNEPRIDIVGPIIRDEIRAQKPRSGDYLLAYFNKGEHQYLPHVEQALLKTKLPVVVYGIGEMPMLENIRYKPLSKTEFAKDLAGCKALLSTCGNQTMGECLHLKKPVLVMPEDCFEQNLNAFMVERMGIGRHTSLNSISAEVIEGFLDNCFNFRSNMQGHMGDSRDVAAEKLLTYINELTSASTMRQAA